MFKKLCAVALVIVAMSSTMASAQCTIAAYGDPAGTQSLLSPNEQFFSVYIVLFAEDTANAAAFNYELTGSGLFLQDRIQGPSGNGLFLDELVGTNVALGECAIGFGGLPILIEEYQYAAIPGGSGTVQLSANTNQGATPVYVTCNSDIRPCDEGAELIINAVIEASDSSFGSIKSLYN
jgi:hypothetical protein